ncbi:MAG TPA: alkaline phosphatase family protein [Tepidisphaeraceae bacterium]|jgi:hypothetical protein|nr:alkaline phosphatase family protein [Tepidisphaeraceae bacterium]
MQPELDDVFARDTLIRPSHESANLVHLIRALATRSGVQDIEQNGPITQLIDLIGQYEHLIFVLLDGLGMNIIRRLPTDSFLVRSLQLELNATCPSTTACALTTIATAAYPNRHSVTGWFSYLPDHNLSIANLPFVERFTGESLVTLGLQPETIFPLRPMYPRMTHDPMLLTPSFITSTPYNIYARGGTTGVGYHSIHEAVDLITEHIREAQTPTYTHLYLPEIDSMCHKRGVDHEDVVPLVMQIDAELGRLATSLGGRARIAVSADHGLIDVPRPQQTLLMQGDPLLSLLVVPPTGDARLPIFHVREGKHDEFVEQFHRRFDDGMILVETDRAEQMQLFGPGPMSPTARKRFGDYVGIAYRPVTLAYHPPGKPVGELYLAVHAGLSPQEMQVPLCVA